MEYSICDANKDFGILANEIRTFIIKNNNSGDHLDESELDLITLNNIRAYLLSLMAYINTFCKLQEKVSEDEFIKILDTGFNKKELEGGSMTDIIYGYPIKSLVVMVHFQIDSYFGEICKQKNMPQQCFYNKMTEILKNIDNNETSKNVLQCLSYFRNSFHNNGIHSIHNKRWEEIKTQEDQHSPSNGRLDRTFKSEKLEIEFKHNGSISYNWKIVYLLIKESVNILKTIIKNNSVKKE
jgi:hypothetical protein